MHRTARNIILSILIGAPVFGLSLEIYRHYNPIVSQHFINVLPDEYEIIAENHDMALFDGSVSWLIKIDHPKEFNPSDFIEIPYSSDQSSRYYEVQFTFVSLYPEASRMGDRIKILVGGPDGNSFIGIIGKKTILLYRFWT